MSVIPQDEAAALEAALCAVEAAYDADDGAQTLALGLPLLPQLEAAPSLAPKLTLRLRWVLCRALARNGRAAEALAMAEGAVRLSEALADDGARAASLTWRGGALWGLGELAQALDDLGRAHALLPADPDPALALGLNNLLAVVHGSMGEHEAALAFSTEALRLAQLQHEQRPHIEAHYLGNLAGRHGERASALREEGHAEQARTHDEAQLTLAGQALALAAQLGLEHPRAIFQQLQAAALARLGHHERALAAYEQQRRLALAHGVQASLVYAAQDLAPLLRQLGQAARARAVLEEGIALAEQLGIARHASGLYRQLSDCCAEAGEFERALQHHRRFHTLHADTVLTAARQRSQALSLQLRTEQSRHEAERQALRATTLEQRNAQLSRRASDLERETLRDALTGLGNRRELETRLPALLAQAAAQPQGLSLALLDLDHFKQINDRFSHPVGDAVLREVARLLREQARSADMTLRYGGEELLWVLVDSDLQAAAAACERLRLAVQRHDWDALQPGLQVTLSAGLAALQPGDDPARLIARADAGLYAAKAAGRNRLQIAD